MLSRVNVIFPIYFLGVSVVTVGNVNYQRILVLQGKYTENHLLLSFNVAYFLPLFHYNGGMLGMKLYKL